MQYRARPYKAREKEELCIEQEEEDAEVWKNAVLEEDLLTAISLQQVQ